MRGSVRLLRSSTLTDRVFFGNISSRRRFGPSFGGFSLNGACSTGVRLPSTSLLGLGAFLVFFGSSVESGRLSAGECKIGVRRLREPAPDSSDFVVRAETGEVLFLSSERQRFTWIAFAYVRVSAHTALTTGCRYPDGLIDWQTWPMFDDVSLVDGVRFQICNFHIAFAEISPLA